MDRNWKAHYTCINAKKLAPAATLLKALSLFDYELPVVKHAIDLGCGTGIDALTLIDNGWQVIAIDKQEKAIEQLRNAAGSINEKKLELMLDSFEHIHLPFTTLINASFALPFCSPEHFNSLWNRIENAIVNNGRFAGHFFGLRDSWANHGDMTFHSKKQVQNLFGSFMIESFNEFERAGTTISGIKKHWHVFHIVAKKLTAS